MLDQKYPFSSYAKGIIRRISQLEKLQIPVPLSWEIDWKTLAGRNYDKERANIFYSRIKIFTELKAIKNLPVVYCFDLSSESSSKRIFEAYCKLREESLKVKRELGLKATEFRNICHVPDTFRTSKCLYVGSVRSNMSQRLMVHLGYEKSGRTGALYLQQLSQHFSRLPKITFSAFVFDKRYAGLREHMEYVFQHSRKPILGKPSLKSLD